ncbi:PEP-CTERM sorting domain-containing protein, partial [Rhodopirellula sallentina]|uniref:PEP-CTERM sorting domain-containing protein n=1 Tax=Rhodopirellula sallentina TaxID=1263869 RepID=UPI0005C7DACA
HSRYSIDAVFGFQHGVDFDFGFLSIQWAVQPLGSATVDRIADITTSSLNGETELYEFGILDAAAADITAADIANYDARRYTGDPGSGQGDDNFSGAVNSLGDADELLLPEHLGTFASVTYDAEATIVGNLADNPGTSENASDNISLSGIGINQYTLWYGGFDVGTDTNVGNPTASFNFSGDTTITAVPEPSGIVALATIGMFGHVIRRRRKRTILAS